MVTINNYSDKMMLYCGFNKSSNRKYISEDVFALFEDIVLMTEKYIGDISKGFKERTAANGMIIFGLLQTNIIFKRSTVWKTSTGLLGNPHIMALKKRLPS